MFNIFSGILLLAIVACARSVDDHPTSVYRMLFEKFEFKPQHCGHILEAGHATSGVYNIFHDAAGSWGQRVYCDMDTDGGGWTVIQKRGQYGNNAYYFYRNWTEYARGFGDPAKEYWIGNRALHALTSGNKTMTLRIVLSNTTRDSQSLDYERFVVGSENDDFVAEFGEFSGPEGWDSMTYASSNKFSTFDRDNDLHDENCAEKYRGGWWYASCMYANLNGLNLNGQHASPTDGIDWAIRDGYEDLYHYSYPSARMMVRPTKFT